MKCVCKAIVNKYLLSRWVIYLLNSSKCFDTGHLHWINKIAFTRSLDGETITLFHKNIRFNITISRKYVIEGYSIINCIMYHWFHLGIKFYELKACDQTNFIRRILSTQNGPRLLRWQSVRINGGLNVSINFVLQSR